MRLSYCDLPSSGVTRSTHKTQCVHLPGLFSVVEWGWGWGSLAPPPPHSQIHTQNKMAYTSAKSWVRHCSKAYCSKHFMRMHLISLQDHHIQTCLQKLLKGLKNCSLFIQVVSQHRWSIVRNATEVCKGGILRQVVHGMWLTKCGPSWQMVSNTGELYIEIHFRKFVKVVLRTGMYMKCIWKNTYNGIHHSSGYCLDVFCIKPHSFLRTMDASRKVFCQGTL